MNQPAAMDPAFELSPIGATARRWMFALTVLLPTVVVGAAQTMFIRTAAQLSHTANVFGHDIPWLTVVPVLVALLVSLLLWWMWLRSIVRRRVAVVGYSVEVSGSFANERVALADIDLERARVVDLDERTELRPLIKFSGTAAPGFRSGRFLLRNFRRAIVCMAGGKRVLWLPTRTKFDLLLELRQPQVALEALRLRQRERG